MVFKDQITPPCLHNNDVTEVMETTLMQHEDLPEAEVPYSEILSEAELSLSADITQVEIGSIS
jgi:hypothetical protein